MNRMSFFALRDDLQSVFGAVEAARQLVYVPFGRHEVGKTLKCLMSIADVPSLGEADHESSMGCSKYLIANRSLKIVDRLVDSQLGVYVIDQLLNPDTIVFTGGGLRDGAVISGEVSTTGATTESRQLMKTITREFSLQFKRVKAFHVGPQAARLLEAGVRFTQALQSTRDYDLTPPT